MAEMAVWLRPESGRRHLLKNADDLRSKIAATVTDLRSVRAAFGTATLEEGGEKQGGAVGASDDARKIVEEVPSSPAPPPAPAKNLVMHAMWPRGQRVGGVGAGGVEVCGGCQRVKQSSNVRCQCTVF
eukprot:1689155-Rhodomonas_salina.1